MPFAELMQQRVFTPLGMTRSTVRPAEAMTWPLALGHRKTIGGTFAVVRPVAHDTRLWPAGYAFTTAADLARFALALLDAGRIDGRGALNAATPRRMLMPHAELPNLYDDGRYGYATFQFTMRGQRVAEHVGTMVGSSAMLRMVPERDFAVIALSNSETLPVKTAEAAMAALLPLSASVPFTSDGPPLAMAAAEMASYAGRYENRGHFVLGVESGRLVARHDGGPPLVVTKVGGRRFVASGAGDRPRLRFLLSPAAAGRPAYLHFALWGFRKTS
jgi:CubicO group peptidase (beta-lactamase class C family)